MIMWGGTDAMRPRATTQVWDVAVFYTIIMLILMLMIFIAGFWIGVHSALY